jgi:CheY-like chemotaxis protein
VPASRALFRARLHALATIACREPDIHAGAAATDIPDERERSVKRVAIIGFGEQETATLKASLEAAEIACLEVSLDAAAKVTPLEAYDAVLLAVGGDVAPEATVRGVLGTSVRPVLAVGNENGLGGYLDILRRPDRAFAIQPCSAEELIMRIAALPSSAAVSSSGPVVLIADDDPVAAAVLEATLSKEGLACHIATNGDEALALARQLRPVAVLLDVNMPGRDGFHVLQAIRRDRTLAQTRVVMLTGRVDESDVRRGCMLGANDYIGKPFTAADVAQRVMTLLQKAS